MAKLQPTQTGETKGKRVTCRQCGAHGRETPDDPCPGLCPACLDRGMAEIDRALGAEVRKLGVAPPVSFLTERLRALGLTESAISALEGKLT
jgi:hypothetical protein